MQNRTRSVVAFLVSTAVVASTHSAGAQIVIQQPAPVYAPGYAAPVYPQSLYPQPVYAPRQVGPRVIRDWQEGEPIPPGYHKSERTRLGMVIGGASLFGVMYLVTALGVGVCADKQVACGGSTSHEDPLLIPGVGPFIQMSQTSSTTGSFFLAIDGLAQLGGVAMLTYGLAVPKTLLVRDDVGRAPRLTVSPVVGPGTAGIVGAF